MNQLIKQQQNQPHQNFSTRSRIENCIKKNYAASQQRGGSIPDQGTMML
jgi:hypothetical protein